jgi:uncharacterized protein YigA (DUF484 family)
VKADDVARYLKENPAFFETHAEMLSTIQVPHPHGGRAIPLSDRQMLGLREKNKALEARLAELLQIGEENDAIGGKLHRLCLALLAAQDLQGLFSALHLHLHEDFAVPHSALRLWRGTGNAPVSDDLKRYADSLAQPYCGPSGNAEAAAWFGDGAAHVRSVAHVALRDKECFGMLALGSEDAARFYPEMGTLYLRRLGDVAGAALLRLL